MCSRPMANVHLAPRLARKVGRYAHARQFKPMRKALRRARGYTGQVMRDLLRQLDRIPRGPLRERALDMLVLNSRLLHQQPKDRDKLYSLHEPQVNCISKGKARPRYEFGTKVSVAATIDEGFILGMRTLPDNPYDGHTLSVALEQVEILTDRRPSLVVVDHGYRGHGVETTCVLVSGTCKGITPPLARLLRRRSAIKPEIGHMKTDGRLTPCLLKQGHARRRHLRRLLRLRPQPPQDPRPTQAAFASLDRSHYDRFGARTRPSDRRHGGLTALFRMNYFSQ